MRKKRRRIAYKKNHSYLMTILLCLLVLNIGALTFRLIKSSNSIGKFNVLDKVTSYFDLSSKNVWGFNNDEELARKEFDETDKNSIENQNELMITKDYIIDRLEEYESLIIIKDSSGISSLESVPKPLNIKNIKLDKGKDYILLYHTHATEAFLTDDLSKYHDQDISKSIVSVGDIMSKVLEANGHKVDHVEIQHDLPSYNKSYSRSLNTINNKKQENSNLKIFLDIHRDGIDKNAEYKDRFLETARINVNGISTATFSLVIGPDSPNYDSVLSFAKYIKAVSDTLYPNLCTRIIIKPAGKYNLNVSDYSALIEVGSNLVTLEEAKESAKLIGEILSIAIDNIIE